MGDEAPPPIEGPKESTGMLRPAETAPHADDHASLIARYGTGVVRISAVQSTPNLLKPHETPANVAVVGSGFAVGMRIDGRWFPQRPTGEEGPEPTAFDPLFVTNAHVARNAVEILIQFSKVGSEMFPARTAMIYEDFDLALVQLRNPEEALAFLRGMNTSHAVFSIEHVHKLLAPGTAVSALGYPLGNEHLQAAQGTLSGVANVEGKLSRQMDAPISAGNSGGPLITQLPGGRQLGVVGVDYASSAEKEAQNVNYAIMPVHVRQLLRAYHRAHLEGGAPADARSFLETQRAEKRPRVSDAGVADGVVDMAVVPQKPAREAAWQPLRRYLRDWGASLLQESWGAAAPASSSSTKAALPGQETAQEAQQRRGQEAAVLRRYDEAAAAIRPRELRIAPLGALVLPSRSQPRGPCEGPLIAKVQAKSVFRQGLLRHPDDNSSMLQLADEAVSSDLEGWFLAKVNGVALDRSGAGVLEEAAGERVSTAHLLPMVDDLTEPIEVEVCKADQRRSFRVTMAWRPEYEYAIAPLRQTIFHPLDRETFAGVTIQQMSLSHIVKVFELGWDLNLCKYLKPDSLTRARLMITWVTEDSYASRLVSTGMVVSKINGVQVDTMAEYRDAFWPRRHLDKGGLWTLETEDGHTLQVNFLQQLEEQAAQVATGAQPTIAVVWAARRVGGRAAGLLQTAQSMFHASQVDTPPVAPPQADGAVIAGAGIRREPPARSAA